MDDFQEDDAQRWTIPTSFSLLFCNNNNSSPDRENIVQRLFDQQYCFTPRIHPFVITNRLRKNLVPNFSVENAERPNCFLRKFSYDGKFLMAFSADITSVELFEYQGPGAATQLLSRVSSNEDSLSYDEKYNDIRRNIFDCFFKHKHSIKVTSNEHQLNRECSLFTEDNRYLIVASTAFTNELLTSFHNRYQNNESITISARVFLEDYSFYSIDMYEGKVVDKIHFKTDKIYIAYNHGVYLYKNLFAILSVQHQTIHLYYIFPNGQFVPNRNIGRFCLEEDKFLFEKTNEPLFGRRKSVAPFRETIYNGLKHRLLVFAFKQAKRTADETGNLKPLNDFYRDFDLYVGLRMWKMQLIDEEHILIKYEQESTLVNKLETCNVLRFWNIFAIYNWKTTEIVNIYPQYSPTLLQAYENYCDYFRHPPSYPCSPGNNYYARRAYNEFKKTIFENKTGSYKEAIRNILSLLPHGAQSITSSPYLDLTLFCYDDKVICSSDKPRYTSEMPIRFYNRNNGRLLFRFHTGQRIIALQDLQAQTPPPQSRRLIAFIFHPNDPFIISVQRYNSHYLLHFHIRHFNPIESN